MNYGTKEICTKPTSSKLNSLAVNKKSTHLELTFHPKINFKCSLVIDNSRQIINIL